MKKIIFIEDHASELTCDNPLCDYKAVPGEYTFGPHLVGLPCPKCGESLLTQEDFTMHVRLVAVIDWLNRWFGWLGKEAPDHDYKSLRMRTVHGHLEVKKDG